jgi:hypothetical protein
MKWPHASFTDQQASSTFFVVPEIAIEFALGRDVYRNFCVQRTRARSAGGELSVIGWPDGTTITYHRLDASQAMDVPNVVATYRASAAMHRVRQKGASA